ncbi:MAG: DUF4113 domain-containing protein [Pseudanabaena sp.]
MNFVVYLVCHWKRSIRFACEGIRQDWKMRTDMRSPRYTTRWDELLVVKAN